MKLRYQLAMLFATLFQLLAMTFLVLFYDLVFHTCNDISPTFALGSLYCQIVALALYFVADYLLSKKGDSQQSAPKPKRHYKEWSERRFNILFAPVSLLCMFALWFLFVADN